MGRDAVLPPAFKAALCLCTYQYNLKCFIFCEGVWDVNCEQSILSFTVLEDGTVAGWRTADYLFSEDATCPDTLRIFESKDYLWNKVTVFQSLFLSACEKRQSVKSVHIGHYVLPPASVQDEVRNVVGRLIWECEDQQPVAQGSQKNFSSPTEDEYSEGEVSRGYCEPSDTDSSESEACLCGYLQEYPVSNMLTGYVSMDNLQQYSGDLCDFHPRCFRCSNSEKKAC
ncbi:telomere repeats-binding bouquet formation protein 2 isoform X2 [Xiphias gladius]|uniref:telomere repeats-binding bouquet formation protein 2 isoform X2 n=1 Tax=Xiphias gladius TaxID=8245 RepID=UPI001A9868FC|nr:telomere repeats-binding bouquet formation protein 2 isoform X2 [Xiphias gladius]